MTATFGIYQLGYMKGISEYAADPRRKEKEIAKNLIMSQAWKSLPAGGELQPPRIVRSTEAIHMHVSAVGARVVAGARLYVEAKIRSREARLRDPSLSDNVKAGIREEIAEFREKLNMCKGDWNYIVIENPVPNAFVSDLAPRKIFVNSGLLTSIQATSDELALVLAHEISHLIHGHTSKSNELHFYVSLAQIMFLSVIPLDFFTPLLIYFGGNFETFELMQHSRECESEADETGLKIAALACFDTHKGPHVFKKLSEFTEQFSGEAQTSHWSDSHPMPLDREESLIKLSQKINCDDMKRCHGLLERMGKMWGGKR
jgi:predicted Zn-dependent protease